MFKGHTKRDRRSARTIELDRAAEVGVRGRRRGRARELDMAADMYGWDPTWGGNRVGQGSRSVFVFFWGVTMGCVHAASPPLQEYLQLPSGTDGGGESEAEAGVTGVVAPGGSRAASRYAASLFGRPEYCDMLLQLTGVLVESGQAGVEQAANLLERCVAVCNQQSRWFDRGRRDSLKLALVDTLARVRALHGEGGDCRDRRGQIGGVEGVGDGMGWVGSAGDEMGGEGSGGERLVGLPGPSCTL